MALTAAEIAAASERALADLTSVGDLNAVVEYQKIGLLKDPRAMTLTIRSKICRPAGHGIVKRHLESRASSVTMDGTPTSPHILASRGMTPYTQNTKALDPSSLWSQCREVFEQFDADRDGRVETSQVRAMLVAMNHDVSSEVYKGWQTRHAALDHSPFITLSGFMDAVQFMLGDRAIHTMPPSRDGPRRLTTPFKQLSEQHGVMHSFDYGSAAAGGGEDSLIASQNPAADDALLLYVRNKSHEIRTWQQESQAKKASRQGDRLHESQLEKSLVISESHPELYPPADVKAAMVAEARQAQRDALDRMRQRQQMAKTIGNHLAFVARQTARTDIKYARAEQLVEQSDEVEERRALLFRERELHYKRLALAQHDRAQTAKGLKSKLADQVRAVQEQKLALELQKRDRREVLTRTSQLSPTPFPRKRDGDDPYARFPRPRQYHVLPRMPSKSVLPSAVVQMAGSQSNLDMPAANWQSVPPTTSPNAFGGAPDDTWMSQFSDDDGDQDQDQAFLQYSSQESLSRMPSMDSVPIVMSATVHAYIHPEVRGFMVHQYSQPARSESAPDLLPADQLATELPQVLGVARKAVITAQNKFRPMSRPTSKEGIKRQTFDVLGVSTHTHDGVSNAAVKSVSHGATQSGVSLVPGDGSTYVFLDANEHPTSRHGLRPLSPSCSRVHRAMSPGESYRAIPDPAHAAARHEWTDFNSSTEDAPSHSATHSASRVKVLAPLGANAEPMSRRPVGGQFEPLAVLVRADGSGIAMSPEPAAEAEPTPEPWSPQQQS